MNSNRRHLDLVLSNLQCLVEPHDTPFVPADAHHPPLSIQVSFTITREANSPRSSAKKRYNFRKTNYQKLYTSLCNVDWAGLQNTTNVNGVSDVFYNIPYGQSI